MVPTLIDYISIAPNPRYKNLSVKEKVALIDASMAIKDPLKRGLKIDMTVSHSGRRINNRLYSPHGQAMGVKDFMSPYPKPVIKNHDRESDPLGRFIGGSYVDTTSEALKHMRSMQDMAQIQQAYKVKDWEKLAAVMIKSRVLVNPDWEGLGKLQGVLRITDTDAIEKFIDQRYLTFSSGASSNSLVCSHCLADWMVVGPCDHTPGEIIDGVPVFHITDEYHPNELSIVTHPADNLSKVNSMEWVDCDQEKIRKCHVDDSTIYITDSVFTMNAKILTVQTNTAIASNEETFSQVVDELNGDTIYEASMLVELHDRLHCRYDADLKYSEKPGASMPRDAFALHAKMHDLAGKGGFRDSFMNGPLDDYSAAGEITHEFKNGGVMDAEQVQKLLQEMKDSLKLELLAALQPIVPEPVAVVVEEVPAVLVDAEVPPVVEVVAEPEVVAVVEPVVVADAAAENSTLELDNQKQLQDDYRNALLQIDDLKRKAVEVLDAHAKVLKKDFSELADTEQFTVMYGWFCEVKDGVVNKTPATETPKIENPSISGTSVTVITDSATVPTLDDSQKSIVARYKKLTTESSVLADQYIAGLKRKKILALNFDPNKF